MGLFSVTLLCNIPECSARWDDLIERDTRDDIHQCVECGEMSARRTWSVPNIVGREAYIDGGRRSDSTYQRVKDASKLESQMYNLPPDKRGDIKKELRKLRGYADSNEKKKPRDGGGE